MIEWKAVCEAAFKHTAAAGWKHRHLSHVEQERVFTMPKVLLHFHPAGTQIILAWFVMETVSTPNRA